MLHCQHVKSVTKCMFHVCFGGRHFVEAQYVALPMGITDVGPVTEQCQFVPYQSFVQSLTAKLMSKCSAVWLSPKSVLLQLLPWKHPTGVC